MNKHNGLILPNPLVLNKEFVEPKMAVYT